jgi:hypothetical protein
MAGHRSPAPCQAIRRTATEAAAHRLRNLIDKTTAGDLLPEQYSRERVIRQRMIAYRAGRQLPIGRTAPSQTARPRRQVQEMLRAERIFEQTGIEDELAVYNRRFPTHLISKRQQRSSSLMRRTRACASCAASRRLARGWHTGTRSPMKTPGSETTRRHRTSCAERAGYDQERRGAARHGRKNYPAASPLRIALSELRQALLGTGPESYGWLCVARRRWSHGGCAKRAASWSHSAARPTIRRGSSWHGAAKEDGVAATGTPQETRLRRPA